MVVTRGQIGYVFKILTRNFTVLTRKVLWNSLAQQLVLHKACMQINKVETRLST